MSLIYLEDIDAVQRKFTELGRSIAEVSTANSDSIQGMLEGLSHGVDKVVTDVGSNEALIRVRDPIAGLSGSVAALPSFFTNLLTSASAVFGGLTKDVSGVQEVLKGFAGDLSTVGSGAVGGVSAGVVGGVEGALLDRKKGGGLANSYPARMIKREGAALKSTAHGFANKLSLPVPGMLLAGSVGVMAYGFMDSDRVRAEAGEVKNVLESAYDAGIKKVWAKATAAGSDIQEVLQKFYGIARAEYQATQKAFVQGGVGIIDMSARIGKAWGKDIPNNIVTSMLALDKMFGLAGGTSANKAVSYMHNYGMGIEEAVEYTKDLSLNEAARSLGMATFTKNVETAASVLSGFGFSIQGVSDHAVLLQESFESIGIPKQFAGKLVGTGLSQMAQGMSHLSDDWKAFLAKRMTGKEGVEAVQWFEEAFSRVKREGGVDEYKEFAVEMYKFAHEQSKGDAAREYWMLAHEMGLGSAGATVTREIGEAAERGDSKGATQATEEGLKVLKRAYLTEAEATSKFQLQMNAWMKGLAKIGQGLLGMVGKALAMLIAYVRSWGPLFESAIQFDPKRTDRIMAKLMEFIPDLTNELKLIKQGGSQMKDAGKDMLGNVFGATAKVLGKAWSEDLSGKDRREYHGYGGGSVAEPSGGFGEADRSQPATETKVVYVPINAQEPREFDAGLSKASKRRVKKYAKQHDQSWVGGGLMLKSDGVTANNDLAVSIGGNCPRCGLRFGGDAVSAPTVRTFAGGEPAGAAKGGAYTSMGLVSEGRFTGRDVEAASRTLATEMGGYSKGRHNEAVGILQTLLNRGGSKGGGKLYKYAAGKGGWGEVGKAKRAYGTRKKPNEKTVNFVRDFLRGDVAVPAELKDATHFFHTKPGTTFAKEKQGYKGGVPYFAKDRGMLATYDTPGSGSAKAIYFTNPKKADTVVGAQARDELESAWNSKHGKS